MLYAVPLVVFGALLSEVYGAGAPSVPRVCIDDGCLRGTWQNGLRGDRFQAFFGIPYAKPPVGALRFANPVPNEPWGPTETLDASGLHPKSVCFQKNDFTPERGIEGAEDCLYLNVYRPANGTAGTPEGGRLATIVYIHGGGYFSGYISPLVLGAERFMDQGRVILVTVAYRLGVFGFLSTGDAASPGNYGLKDQRAALRWVRRNIAAFGGSPDMVTLMGQSAGGSSVHLQMMDRNNEGLFQRAISLSGNALAPWTLPQPDPVRFARNHATAVGIKNARKLNTTQLVDALRQIDGYDLIDSVKQLKEDINILLIVYGPVIEPAESEEAFLTEDPRVSWATGKFLDVPWLTGYVPNEGFIFTAALPSEYGTLPAKSINDGLKTFLLNYLRGSDTEEAFAMLNERFFANGSQNGSSDGNLAHQLAKLFTESSFLYPLHRSVKQRLALKNATIPTTSVYRFNFRGRYSYSTVYSSSQQDEGVVHCDELMYTFRAPVLFLDFPRRSAETEMADRWLRYLTDFVYSGQTMYAPPTAVEFTNTKDVANPVNENTIELFDAELDDFWTRFYAL